MTTEAQKTTPRHIVKLMKAQNRKSWECNITGTQRYNQWLTSHQKQGRPEGNEITYSKC